MKLRVTHDRIVIRPEALPTRTESGLHLVWDRQSSTMKGTVVALGEGPVSPRGVRLPHVVGVGDRVIFGADTGSELMFEKEVLIAMREDEVLAVIQE